MLVNAEGLLLVGPSDLDVSVQVEDGLAVFGVVLEGLPRLAVVHTLVQSHRVWLGVAKMQGDVGQLVLLLQGDGQADVSGDRVDFHQVRLPTGHVVGVVEVGEELRRVLEVTPLAVTGLTFPLGVRRAVRSVGRGRGGQGQAVQ